MEELNREKERELEELQSKVTSAITRKDENISRLNEELQNAQLKLQQLQKILDKKRNALLK